MRMLQVVVHEPIDEANTFRRGPALPLGVMRS